MSPTNAVSELEGSPSKVKLGYGIRNFDDVRVREGKQELNCRGTVHYCCADGAIATDTKIKGRSPTAPGRFDAEASILMNQMQ